MHLFTAECYVDSTVYVPGGKHVLCNCDITRLLFYVIGLSPDHSNTMLLMTHQCHMNMLGSCVLASFHVRGAPGGIHHSSPELVLTRSPVLGFFSRYAANLRQALSITKIGGKLTLTTMAFPRLYVVFSSRGVEKSPPNILRDVYKNLPE